MSGSCPLPSFRRMLQFSEEGMGDQMIGPSHALHPPSTDGTQSATVLVPPRGSEELQILDMCMESAVTC